MQDLCSVSFEDSATIQSTFLDRRNSSDVIINADIVLVLETIEPIREGKFRLIYGAEWKERKEKVILKYVKSNPNIREFIEEFDKLRFTQEIINGLLWIHDKSYPPGSQMIDHNIRTFVGEIPAYMEPQLFISNEYRFDEKSDVYSLGVFMWEISSGQPLFNSESLQKVIALISNNKREMPICGTPSLCDDGANELDINDYL
ncbi:hypothetical protein C1646_754456 [Rhizophagus diaphanus]|nr:hypothetical protein C1646_754456 [Rhizophagus diaphanus] [Rhizophagus sp. MUCL 43196]